jgi:hypothetical protein
MPPLGGIPVLDRGQEVLVAGHRLVMAGRRACIRGLETLPLPGRIDQL